MPLRIQDDETVALVTVLSDAKGLTPAQAVRTAVTSELQRLEPEIPLRETFAALRAPPSSPADGFEGGQGVFRRTERRLSTPIMAIFVDASALVAIIAGEPDADALSDR